MPQTNIEVKSSSYLQGYRAAKLEDAEIARKKCVYGLGNTEYDAGFDDACLAISKSILSTLPVEPEPYTDSEDE